MYNVFICYSKIYLQPSPRLFLEAIAKLNVRVQIQCDHWSTLEDMIMEPGERALSWPTLCFIEALESTPIEGISLFLKSITKEEG